MACGVSVINIAACTCPPSGGGGGGLGDVAAVNGVSQAVNAFTTVDYISFDPGGNIKSASFLTPAVSQQEITEAGTYIVQFSWDTAFDDDEWTLRSIKGIANSTFATITATGSGSYHHLVEWTAGDVSSNEYIKWQITNNSGSTKTLGINIYILKVA